MNANYGYTSMAAGNQAVDPGHFNLVRTKAVDSGKRIIIIGWIVFVLGIINAVYSIYALIQATNEATIEAHVQDSDTSTPEIVTI